MGMVPPLGLVGILVPFLPRLVLVSCGPHTRVGFATLALRCCSFLLGLGHVMPNMDTHGPFPGHLVRLRYSREGYAEPAVYHRLEVGILYRRLHFSPESAMNSCRWVHSRREGNCYMLDAPFPGNIYAPLDVNSLVGLPKCVEYTRVVICYLSKYGLDSASSTGSDMVTQY